MKNAATLFRQAAAYFVSQREFETASLSSAGITRSEQVPFELLAETQVAIDNLFRSTNAGEKATVLKMHDRFQDLALGRPEGFNRVTAVAYYESVASSRVGPYPIDLMNFEGEEAERMKSLAALAAVAKSLDKLDNKEAREVAADLRVLMKSLDKERAWFDREYSKHYGKPRQPA